MNRSEQRALLASLIAGSTVRSGTVNYTEALGIVKALEMRLLATGCQVLIVTMDDQRGRVVRMMEKVEVLGGDESDV